MKEKGINFVDAGISAAGIYLGPRISTALVNP